MFSPRDRVSDPFLTGEIGVWARDERVLYFKAVYTEEAYTDGLFATYNLAFPDQVLTRARPMRRAAFLAGRVGAKTLLQKLGIDGEVPVGQNRAPRWPEGVYGSISHSRNYVICVVSLEFYVGVDIEFLDERALLESAPEIAPEKPDMSPEDLLLTFSAKESLFKVLYPLVQVYFGFECAKVDRVTNTQFKVKLTQHLAPNLAGAWTGDWEFDEDLMMTLIALPITLP